VTKRTHGHTQSGTPITDELVDRLTDEAERGDGTDALVARRGKRGRPRLGSEPSTVESVRLDPELKDLLVRRAEEQGVPVSEVIRNALREHLEAS
jgi:hypothetical protein